MRHKSSPYFLSQRERISHAFMHIANRFPLSDLSKKYKKPTKNNPDIRLNLSRSFPHSVTIQMIYKSYPINNCLQSITLPFTAPLLVYFKRSRRADIYFGDSPEMTFWFEEADTKNRLVITADIPDLSFILYGLSSNSLEIFATVQFDKLHVDVYIRPSALLVTSHFIQHAICQQQFEKLFSFITLQKWPKIESLDDLRLPLFAQNSETQEDFITSVKAIYALIQAKHSKTSATWNNPNILQPKELKITLLPYQVEAVRWMMFRETNVVPVIDQNWIHSYFVKIKDEMFFSALSGHLVTKPPTIPLNVCLGGILADEMGLGKTLEILSLILLRPCDSVTARPLFDIESEADLLDEFAYEELTEKERAFLSPHSPLCSEATDPMTEENVFCVCGCMVTINSQVTIACTRCRSSCLQHVECVQYKPVVETTDGNFIKLNYICPLCWKNLRVYSKASLIISPDHIWRQWQDELLKHVDISNLKILVYEGLDRPIVRLTHNSSWSLSAKDTEVGEATIKPGFVQPAELATADIVLTTYAVMQRELGWASVSAEQRLGEGHRPALRSAQRYLAPPSPLACVIWWRICLDEAQMVESVISKTARMLSEVGAVHRWCVTGTPAERSLSDFYGLLAYLRVEPFSFRHYWNGMLYQPFIESLNSSKAGDHLEGRISGSGLVRVLSRLLWRNTKALVGDQLKLPGVTEQIHWVEFTAVERYIHDRVFSECVDALHQLLAEAPNYDLNSPLAALPGTIHWSLVAFVTRARQACTHASLVVINSSTGAGGGAGSGARRKLAGRRENGRFNGPRPSADPTLQVSRSCKLQGTGCASMIDVIRRVVDDVHQECEACYRTWVFNKNGTAACFILKEMFLDAAVCYREVLRTAVTLESSHGVLCDWSQRLHAITNLHWLLQCCSVPLENSSSHQPVIGGTTTVVSDVKELPPLNQPDPRIDRDLVLKARLLRLDYLKLRSRLLSKARDKLDLEIARTEKLLLPAEFPVARGDGDAWLVWLSEALEILAQQGILDQVPLMVEASLQGGSRFRTTLLQARSGTMFRSLLLVDLKTVLDARRHLSKAMTPLNHSWTSFVANGEAERTVLQSYYACCVRDDQRDSKTGESGNQESSKASPRKRCKRNPSSKCAYCLASEALQVYRQAINHEKCTTSSVRALKRTAVSRLLEEHEEEMHAESSDGLLSTELTAVALVNPFIVALQTVAAQVAKVRIDGDNCWVKSMAAKLDALVQSLFRELLCTGRVQMLTKEWWNFHDDTEQFVLRLQATNPTDLAFIKPEEVDIQLHQHSVGSLENWSTLQSRLSHLTFLRNALHEHSTTFGGRGGSGGGLECPTCLQAQSPSRPTFVLLPGCWHSLCLPCYDRIRGDSVRTRRRCPLCRKPFETEGHDSRRRPLTLLHFDNPHEKKRPPDAPLASNAQNDAVIGDHSSKIQEVIRCLKQIKANDVNAKAIVFSSWISVLNTIGYALEQNGILFATFFKAREIVGLGRFRCDGSPAWVLLLPVQLGANGLNLIEANHVLLVDPLPSHGQELQAIARLHRIGQRRSCWLHRFLVRDSIETALYSVSAPLLGADSSPSSSRSEVEDTAWWCTAVGAIPRRSSAMGPGEDRARVLQMTIGQLVQLLRVDIPKTKQTTTTA